VRDLLLENEFLYEIDSPRRIKPCTTRKKLNEIYGIVEKKQPLGSSINAKKPKMYIITLAGTYKEVGKHVGRDLNFTNRQIMDIDLKKVENKFYKDLSKGNMISKYFLNHKTPNRSIYEYKHGIKINPKKYADFYEKVIIKYA